MSYAINLLPDHLRPQNGPGPKHILCAALAGIILICGGMLGYQFWQEQQAKKELSRISGEMTILQPTLQQVRKNKEIQTFISSRLGVLAQIERERPVKWSDIILQLGQAAPNSLWLTELASDPGGNIIIRGGANDIDTVSKYAGNLRQVPSFANVAFQGLALKSGNVPQVDAATKIARGPAMNYFTFELSIQLKGGGQK